MTTIDLSKIAHMKKCDDMVFNLFLKYNINEFNSVKFIKDFFRENMVDDSISANKLFKSDKIPKVVDILQENTDFFRKTEMMFDKKALRDIILKNKNADLMTCVEKIDKIEQEVIYITYKGIVQLIENNDDELVTDEVQSLFYSILLYCVYEKSVLDYKNN